MTLTPYDEGAFRRRLDSSGSVARRLPTRPQRWIQDEATIQWDEITAVAKVAKVAKRVMDLEGEIAVHGQSVFARTAEPIGRELDAARSRYGTKPANSSTDQFTGTKDVPALLAAFDRENNVANLGSALLATQQLGNRNLAEVVDRGLTPPADTRTPPPRQGFWARNWETYTQQIQALRTGQAFIRLPDDTVRRVATPTLPHVSVPAGQLSAIRPYYLATYFRSLPPLR